MKPVVLLLALFSLLFAAPGEPDESFHEDGIVVIPVGEDYDVATSVAVQDDGKIVAAGFAFNGTDYDVALIRLKRNGDQDMTFGRRGKVMIPVGEGNDAAYALRIQDDGKIVVAGYADSGKFYDVMLVRFLSDGRVDRTFGRSGKVITAVGKTTDVGLGLAIQNDGKLLVTGQTFNGKDTDFLLLRYLPDGTLDPTFGTDGSVVTPVGHGNDIALAVDVKENGLITVIGTSDDCFALARYTADGTIDRNFGNNGTVTTHSRMGAAVGLSMAIQKDGNIVVGGSVDKKFSIIRYYQDGLPDKGFGGWEDLTIEDVGEGDNHGFGVIVQENQKIVIGGRAKNKDGYDFALLRYESDGEIDYAFGEDGTIVIPVAQRNALGNAMALQKDGKIVMVGAVGDESDYDFAVIRIFGDKTGFRY